MVQARVGDWERQQNERKRLEREVRQAGEIRDRARKQAQEQRIQQRDKGKAWEALIVGEECPLIAQKVAVEGPCVRDSPRPEIVEEAQVAQTEE